MNEYFKIDNLDSEFLVHAKQEANIIINNAKTSKEQLKLKDHYNNIINIIEFTIKSTLINNDNVVDLLGETLDLVRGKLLTPLTFSEKEFDKERNYNKRYSDIYKDSLGKIHNSFAFRININKKYNFDSNEEINNNKPYNDFPIKIYISKGGIITGEFILNDLIFKEEIINKNKFDGNDVITIPASRIYYNNKTKYIDIVDHREPMIKKLKTIYEIDDTNIIDEEIKNMKFNIRKFIKLNK